MVKSIIGLLIGIATSDGAIKSIDATAEAYVPGFRGTEYGKTPIRDPRASISEKLEMEDATPQPHPGMKCYILRLTNRHQPKEKPTR
jgi:hypothetical protein